jgi:hypothetical protein
LYLRWFLSFSLDPRSFFSSQVRVLGAKDRPSGAHLPGTAITIGAKNDILFFILSQLFGPEGVGQGLSSEGDQVGLPLHHAKLKK